MKRAIYKTYMKYIKHLDKSDNEYLILTNFYNEIITDISNRFEQQVKPPPIHFSSDSNEWATPSELFNELDQEFNFTLDPCSTHHNAKCERHFTIAENGLKQDWSNDIVFMNPPYGRQIGHWIKKAYEESLNGAIVVCLIPARTDTKYWHDYIVNKAEVRFIKGRLKFGDAKNSAPFPSAIVIYGNSNNTVAL